MTVNGQAADGDEIDVVSIALAHYLHHPSLSGSRPDGSDGVDGEAARVAAALSAFGGCPVVWTVPPAQRDGTAVSGRLRVWATPHQPRNTVLHWVGHGWSNDQQASLALLESPDPANIGGLKPEQLADYIRSREAHLASGDSWAAVMIDGCRSARFAELLHASLLRDDPHAPTRVLVLGVSRQGETQLGVLSDALQRSLASFQGSNEVRLWDLADQLRSRLPDAYIFPPHTNRALRRRNPVVSGTNAPLDIYEDLTAFLQSLSADERLHLIPQARSAEHGDAAWYFVGRRAEKEHITAWLRNETPGMLVVTGDGGQGKSALLGHIAALSRPRLRNLLLRGEYIETPPEAETPPDHVFQGIVHATGMDRRAMIETVASAAGYPQEMLALHDPDTLADSLAGSLSKRDRPFTILVDALDEADDPRGVAEALSRIAGLPNCQVLVGTRPFERNPRAGEPTNLLAVLGPHGFEAGELIQLRRDSCAVLEYVRLRLTGARQVHLGEEERDHAAQMISAQDPDFLGARLAVHEVLSQVTENDPGQLDRVLQDLMTTGLRDDALFAAALTRIIAASPTATPLLTALALSEGRGLPRAGGVWSAAASGIAGRPVTEADIDTLLRIAAPYVLIDAEDGRPVFRLSHEVFRDLMNKRCARDDPSTSPAELHERLALGLAESARQRRSNRTRRPEDRVPPRYIRRFWPEHASRAGQLEKMLVAYPELLPFLDTDAVDRHRPELTSRTLRTMVLAIDMAWPGTGVKRATPSALLQVRLWASRLGVPALAAACTDDVEDVAVPRRPTWTLQGAWWSGVRPQELPGHRAGVTALSATSSGNGEIVVSAGADGALRVTGPRIRFRGSAIGTPGRRPSSVAIVQQSASPPLVVANYESRLQAWNHMGEEVDLGLPSITAFTVTPDGKDVIAATAAEAEIRHYDRLLLTSFEDSDHAEQQAASRRGGWHHDTVLSLATAKTRDGGILLSGSADHSARLWALRDGTLRNMLNHTAPVRAVALGSTSRQLLAATATADRFVELWDAKTGERLHRLALPTAARCVAFGQLSGRPILAAGCDDGFLRLWDAQTGAAQRTIPCHMGPVTALAVRPRTGGADQYVTGGADGRVRVWDVRRVPASRASGHSGGIHTMCWSVRPGGLRQLITAAEDDVVVHACRPSNRAHPTNTVQVHDGIRALLEYQGTKASHPVILDNKGALWIWNTATDRPTRLSGGRRTPLKSLTAVAACGPDTPLLACADEEGTVRLIDPLAVEPETPQVEPLFDRRTFQPVRSERGETDDEPASSFRLVRPASLIGCHAGHVVTCQSDGLLQAWHQLTAQTLWAIRPSVAPAGALATGRWGTHDVVALGTADGMVHVHSLSTGTELACTQLHDGPVRALGILERNVPTLVSGGDDGKIALWAPGVQALALTGHAEAVRCIAVAPKAPLLATGGAQGTLSLWKARQPRKRPADGARSRTKPHLQD
ncbi:NACHT and WD repeat domain-containing protein [Streptomyces sp. NPDC101209]|uniref:NACHT and WD repeat domain-containing protein n=1 Tax=Streptomyces sp. NPDC101209 TaxID=3366129 RepID=UPI0037F2E2C7